MGIFQNEILLLDKHYHFSVVVSNDTYPSSNICSSQNNPTSNEVFVKKS